MLVWTLSIYLVCHDYSFDSNCTFGCQRNFKYMRVYEVCKPVTKIKLWDIKMMGMFTKYNYRNDHIFSFTADTLLYLCDVLLKAMNIWLDGGFNIEWGRLQKISWLPWKVTSSLCSLRLHILSSMNMIYRE